MYRRLFAVLWLVVGVAVWNGFFDLYVSRGAREYGQKQAEHDLGQGPAVSMETVMGRAVHDGVVMSSIWAAVVVASGWATIWTLGRRVAGGPESPAVAREVSRG